MVVVWWYERLGVPGSAICPPAFDAAGDYQYCQADALRWTRANGTVVRGFSATAWFTPPRGC
jgi:hypothetical protein